VKEDGRDLVKIDQQAQLNLQRFDTPITVGMGFTSWETPAGELTRFESVLSIARAPTIAKGVVKDRSIEATITSPSKETSKTIAWEKSWGGFFAVEQSLRHKPMKAGETRKLKCLMPLASDVAVADVTMTAGDLEETDLLDGKLKLLKIEVSMKAAGQKSDFTLWATADGEALKQFTTDMGGLTTYRTTREIATGKSAGPALDLGKLTTVKVGPLQRPHESARMVYRVKLKNDDPAKLFSHCGSQQVKSIDNRTAEVTVVAVRPRSPAKLAAEPAAPVAADSAPSNMIQSDDPRVVKMANETAPDETNTWRIASALELAVFEQMRSKDFTQAFATAAEVARTLQGDCTEHAVLLAALCRARKIPARVAMGLVYYPKEEGFAFHMWNEVWIGDRWVPLDATLGAGGIGAAHLKLADTNLAGADGLSTLLPVAKVMGQVELEIVEP
jgi:hypothetical protein